jgi:hypothetical protein
MSTNKIEPEDGSLQFSGNVPRGVGFGAGVPEELHPARVLSETALAARPPAIQRVEEAEDRPEEKVESETEVDKKQSPEVSKENQDESDDASKDDAIVSDDDDDDGDDESKRGKPPKWVSRRIDRITRDKWEARRQAEEANNRATELFARLQAAEARLAELTAGAEQTPLTSEDVEKLAAARAEKLAASKAAELQFNNDCNEIFESGVRRFSDFEQMMNNYRTVGGLTVEMVQAAMLTGDAPLALHRLAHNLDEAHAARFMPRDQLAVKLTKMVEKAKLKRVAASVSKAPAPVEPIRGGSPKPPVDLEKVSMEEFIAMRNEQIAARRRR